MTPASDAHPQPPVPEVAQRWRDRRADYRRRGDLFDPSGWSVDVIARDRDAASFVTTHHYSGSYPAARLRVGMYGPAETPAGPAPLMGVAVFSVPMTQSVIPSWCGVAPDAGVELGRFVLLPQVGFNGETWFLTRALVLLRDVLRIWRVVSFSDPLPRYDSWGREVKPGHIGQIYQALGAHYLGRTKARTLLLAPDGCVISERAISKIRKMESGWEASARHIVALGADARQAGEAPDAWLRRVLPVFRRLHHPGNHGYLFVNDRNYLLRTTGQAYLRQHPVSAQRAPTQEDRHDDTR